MKPDIETSTVLVISGEKGSGKSHFAKKMADHMGGRMQIIAPTKRGDQFPQRFDWENYDCIAVEDLSAWDAISARVGIETLEAQAREIGKKVLILAHSKEDLRRNPGIKFQAYPANVDMPFETENFFRWVGAPFAAKTIKAT
jgi:energy-coupling factor transporter ATP-binding protein EcfA2